MLDIETNPLYYAAIGGIVLGIATSLHYILKGNVTGISGVIYDVAFFNMSMSYNNYRSVSRQTYSHWRNNFGQRNLL